MHLSMLSSLRNPKMWLVPSPSCPAVLARCASLLALAGLLSAHPAEAVVITFEDLNAPGNGTGGLKVGNQYAAQGVTFNLPTALDYSQGTPVLPGFAHSGTKAVELCYALEFCTGPLQMNFTTAEGRVKVWVGYTGQLDAAQTVVLRAFDVFGQEVGQATATIGPSTGVIPIATPLEVVRTIPSIVRATVGFLGAESLPAQAFNNGLAVDDVEYDIQGTPPPCPTTQPPSLSVTSPPDGKVFLVNSFTLQGAVTTLDPFATMRLDVTGSGGSRTFGPFFVTGGPILIAGITGFLFPGEDTLVVKVQDCAGSAQVTRTVFYRPDVTSMVIHVSDEDGADVPAAEVFVNGAYRGSTDSAGRLVVTPPLPDGTLLAARKRVHESSTYRGNHSAGSFQDWKYRVYITSLPVNDDGSVPAQPVLLEPDPLAPQELRVFRSNTLIGLHVVASLEWDASGPELGDVETHFANASRFLYNATDGQMLYEQVELVDDATFWEDADYRIYANLSLRSYVDCPLGGFFDDSFWCDGSWIHIPRAPCVGCFSWFSKFKTYVHEFGHYGFGLGDEYSDDDGNTQCTFGLSVGTIPPGLNPFQSGMPRASCVMFSENVAPKFCSTRPENPHVEGTDQGDSSCWADIVDRFRDGNSPVRWRLQSPETRGLIPGQINGGTLPIAGWAPRVTVDDRPRANLCAPITFVVTKDDGTRVADQDIWTLTTYGAPIYEGQTDAQGQILATGMHVGDKVGLISPFLPPSYLYELGAYTVTNADCAPPGQTASGGASANAAPTRQLTLAPAAFNLFVAVEPTSVAGQVLVRVSAEPLKGSRPVGLAGGPTVTVTLSGQTQARPVPVQFDARTRTYVGFINDLPVDAEAVLVVTATDLAGQTVARLERVGMTGVDPANKTTVVSADGALSVTIPAGGLHGGGRVIIGPSPVKPPRLPHGVVMVVGPYNVAASTGAQLNAAATLRFHLPRSTDQPGESGFDANTQFRVLRYNPATNRWDDLGPGTFLPSPPEKVTLRTEHLGVVALIAQGPRGRQRIHRNE